MLTVVSSAASGDNVLGWTRHSPRTNANTDRYQGQPRPPHRDDVIGRTNNVPLQYTVGVAIPTFQRPRELRRALDSVLGQTQPPDRIIVSDDANQNNIETLVHSYGDPRLVYVGHTDHHDMTDNWTFALLATGCDLVALLEDDNYWYPQHLELAVAALRAVPQSALYHCRHREAWDDGANLHFYKTVFPPWDDPTLNEIVPDPVALLIDALACGSINSSTVVVRAEALRAMPPFDSRYLMGMDTLMWTRLSLQGGAVYSPYVGATYTYHGSNVSTEKLRTRRATLEARGARRQLARETLADARGEGWRIVAQLKHMAPEHAAPILVLLGHRSLPREVRRAVWQTLRARTDIHALSRHLKLARLVGPAPLYFSDVIDALFAYVIRIKRTLSFFVRLAPHTDPCVGQAPRA